MVDWLLLATFAAIFLGLGHFAELASVQRAIASINLENPLALYLSGILTSQVISCPSGMTQRRREGAPRER